MAGALRRIGIAFGSLVAACLAVWLIAAPLLGPGVSSNPVVWLAAIVLGALVCQDILGRERRAS